MRLDALQEIIGTLKDIQFSDEEIKIILSIQTELELPKSAVKKELLKNLIGNRIGIFNCDGNYKIRKIKRS